MWQVKLTCYDILILFMIFLYYLFCCFENHHYFFIWSLFKPLKAHQIFQNFRK